MAYPSYQKISVGREFALTNAKCYTTNFFRDSISLPSIFQANLNQNSFIIRKMFPFFVFSCSRILYMIHSDNSFGWLLIWHLHSTTEVSLWIFYLIVQLDYTINHSLKYDYTSAMVEVKNNKIKVIKRVSYGYRSFRNFKARIMLMERYKIQKGNMHSYQFAMDAAA